MLIYLITLALGIPCRQFYLYVSTLTLAPGLGSYVPHREGWDGGKSKSPLPNAAFSPTRFPQPGEQVFR